MITVWVGQDTKQKKLHGDKAKWMIRWTDPDGRRKCRVIGSKRDAERAARKVEGQLASGTYDTTKKTKWSDFRDEIEEKIFCNYKPRSRDEAMTSLDHFQRITNPTDVSKIDEKTIADYVHYRKLERGKKPGSTVSADTIKKELRTVQAVLNVAQEWRYLAHVPNFKPIRRRMLKTSETLTRPVSTDHFDLIYKACDISTIPGPASAEWWRTIIMFGITTGWRREEILTFQKSDLDLEAGRVITRAKNNKSGRDRMIPLPQATMEHIKQMPVHDHPEVFHWSHHPRTFDLEFHRIQRAAGIHLDCIIQREHECTKACHVYGMHDLRRAFATLNADKMSMSELQERMGHASMATTRLYVADSENRQVTADMIHVPDVGKDKKTA